MSGVVRDFSKSSISKLRSIANNTNDDLHIFDWFRDTMLTDELNIRDNMNKINYYHQMVMEKYMVGNQKLNHILSNVDSIDCSKSSSFEILYGMIDTYGDTLKRLSESMKYGYIGAESTLFTNYLEGIENSYQLNKYKTIFGTDDINKIMEIIKIQGHLSIIAIKAFLELSTIYPDTIVPDKVIDVILNSLNKCLDKTEDLLSITFSMMEKTAISFRNYVLKYFTIHGPPGKNSFVMVNDATSKYLISSNKFASYCKKAGTTLTVISFAVNVWDDLENNGKTLGQATTHSGVSVGIGVATTLALSSNPLGWVAAAGGFLAQSAFELLYENNFLGIQDALDSVGNWIDDTIDCVSNALSEFGSKLGECTSQFFDFVNPFS